MPTTVLHCVYRNFTTGHDQAFGFSLLSLSPKPSKLFQRVAYCLRLLRHCYFLVKLNQLLFGDPERQKLNTCHTKKLKGLTFAGHSLQAFLACLLTKDIPQFCQTA